MLSLCFQFFSVYITYMVVCHSPHLLLEFCVGVLWFCMSYELRTAALQHEKGNGKGVLGTGGRTQIPPPTQDKLLPSVPASLMQGCTMFRKRFLPSQAQLLSDIPHCVWYAVCMAVGKAWVFEADLFQDCCMHVQKAGSDLSLMCTVYWGNTIVHSSHIALMKIQIWLCWGEWRVWQVFESSGCYIFATAKLVLDLKSITP